MVQQMGELDEKMCGTAVQEKSQAYARCVFGCRSEETGRIA